MEICEFCGGNRPGGVIRCLTCLKCAGCGQNRGEGNGCEVCEFTEGDSWEDAAKEFENDGEIDLDNDGDLIDTEDQWKTKKQRRTKQKSLGPMPVDVPITVLPAKKSKGKKSVSAVQTIKILPLSRGRSRGMSPGLRSGDSMKGQKVPLQSASRYASFFQWASSIGNITQNFSNPVNYMKGRSIHGGYDIAKLPAGKPITAYRAGVVVSIEGSADSTVGWGLNVVLQDENGNRHRYAHLSSVGGLQVGDYVKEGQVFCFMGRSGNVYGPTGVHLHYEVKTPSGALIDPATNDL